LVTGQPACGSALVAFLTAASVTRLVRRAPRPGQAEVYWHPEAGSIATPGLEGMDAMVHLAGENIASGRWNATRKASIRDSRVQGTRLLCSALAQLAKPPEVLVSASAIGYYGDRGDAVLREDSRPGRDFLAMSAAPGRLRNSSTTWYPCRHGAFCMVPSPAGGIGQDALPFKMGVGGIIGLDDSI
jgi:NAD dependent epimerase/dehydratase family enzyme